MREARKIDKSVEIDGVIRVSIDYNDFPLTIIIGEIKNSFISEINNYIGNKIFEEFKRREGTIIQGKIHRISRRDVFVYIEEFNVEALLPADEQITH